MSASPVQPAPVQQNHAASRFDREFDLLLAFCTDSPQREDRVRALLRDPLDWTRFGDIAEHHGLIPHVGDGLAAFRDLIPGEAVRSLRGLCESNARRTLWLSRELLRIVKHLESRDIPALPYKGPALAELLYGNVTARQFSDLDILIHARDYARTKAALSEAGFTPGVALRPPEEAALLRTGYELTFDGVNGRNLLEIQWQVLPRFYAVDFDMPAMFARAVTQSVAGVTVRALRADDLLLALCAHAAKHLWMQLSWMYDIATLARMSQLDWDSLWRQAERLGIRRIVGVTFLSAHRLFGTPLPPQTPRDAAVEAIVADLIPGIAGSAPFDPESIDYFRQFARCREKRSDRARFWWRLATTPSVGEWSTVSLPGPLFPLYRVVRAARLATRAFNG